MKVFSFLDKLLFQKYDPAANKDYRGAYVQALLILYLLGVWHWLRFFSYGHLSFKVADWANHYRFYAILKQAVTSFRLPYYSSNADIGNIHEFMAYLNVSLSPQIFLLYFLSIPMYLMVNTILFYTLGFHGCLLIKKKYQLSLFTFTVLYLLFNYNGHIISHLAIGHPEWYTYFLIPYLFYLLLQFADGQATWRRVLLLSLVFALMIMNGGVHLYMACMFFFVLFILTNFRLVHLKSFTLVCALTFCLACYRILPAMKAFPKEGLNYFYVGYQSFDSIVEAMTVIRTFSYAISTDLWQRLSTDHLVGCWWEYNIYISLTGFLFVIFYGIYLRLRSVKEASFPTFRSMDWPIIVLAVFSIGHNYLFIKNLGIPFVSSVERVPSRFLIYPLMMLVIISCVRFQYYLDGNIYRTKAKLIGLAALAHLAYFLNFHSMLWRHEEWKASFERQNPVLNPTIILMNNHAYERIVRASVWISLVSLGVWLVLYLLSLLASRKTVAGGGK